MEPAADELHARLEEGHRLHVGQTLSAAVNPTAKYALSFGEREGRFVSPLVRGSGLWLGLELWIRLGLG